MNFIISANTDVGIAKDTNQDSMSIMTINTCQGRMVFAILCDGMGGLAMGEVASATVVRAFRDWVLQELPRLCQAPLSDVDIRNQWDEIVNRQNKRIMNYGRDRGVRLGTTVVAMLLTQTRYYIMNVGDSRAYEFCGGMRQITMDHSLVAREVALGHLTPEQAEQDSRRNVLLQCVGASETVYPDMFFGDIRQDAVYMLCSDGFRHEISNQEIYHMLRPEVLLDEHIMRNNSSALIELNKQRQERDNISVALVRTF